MCWISWRRSWLLSGNPHLVQSLKAGVTYRRLSELHVTGLLSAGWLRRTSDVFRRCTVDSDWSGTHTPTHTNTRSALQQCLSPIASQVWHRLASAADVRRGLELMLECLLLPHGLLRPDAPLSLIWNEFCLIACRPKHPPLQFDTNLEISALLKRTVEAGGKTTLNILLAVWFKSLSDVHYFTFY